MKLLITGETMKKKIPLIKSSRNVSKIFDPYYGFYRGKREIEASIAQIVSSSGYQKDTCSNRTLLALERELKLYGQLLRQS